MFGKAWYSTLLLATKNVRCLRKPVLNTVPMTAFVGFFNGQLDDIAEGLAQVQKLRMTMTNGGVGQGLSECLSIEVANGLGRFFGKMKELQALDLTLMTRYPFSEQGVDAFLRSFHSNTWPHLRSLRQRDHIKNGREEFLPFLYRHAESLRFLYLDESFFRGLRSRYWPSPDFEYKPSYREILTTL